MLVAVSKLATVLDVKRAVCEMVGGGVSLDRVVMVYVKDSAVQCTLVRTDPLLTTISVISCPCLSVCLEGRAVVDRDSVVRLLHVLARGLYQVYLSSYLQEPCLLARWQ